MPGTACQFAIGEGAFSDDDLAAQLLRVRARVLSTPRDRPGAKEA